MSGFAIAGKKPRLKRVNRGKVPIRASGNESIAAEARANDLAPGIEDIRTAGANLEAEMLSAIESQGYYLTNDTEVARKLEKPKGR